MSLSDLPDDILRLISFRLNGFDNCFLWMASDSKIKQRLVNNVIVDFDIRYTIPGRYLWPGNFLKRLSKLSRLSLVVDADVYHLPIQNIEIFPIPTLKYLKVNFINFRQLFHKNHLISSNNSTGPTRSSDKKYISPDEFCINLEHLEIPTAWSEGDFFSIDFLRSLPPNLKSLSIPRNYFELDRQNPSNDLKAHLEILPRTITTLDARFQYPINNKPCLDFSKLPPNLTSLATNLLLDEKSYHLIPKNLKSFFLEGNPYNITKLSPHLPTGLESLEITLTANPPTSEMFTHLENLESVSFRPESAVKLDHFFTKCPPKLKSFSCSILAFTNSFVPSQLLSSCLTTLELNNSSGISAEFISALPQSLTDLRISQFALRDPPFEYFALLPRKLKYLHSNLNIIDYTSQLPESLTCLELFTPKPCDASRFDRLPPKLETFEIQKNLPRSIMRQLPASLTDLSVYSNENVDDEIVRMLPRGLKEFSSYDGLDQITDAGIADLPQHLTYLFLFDNVRLTDDGIPLLPRSLTSLNLPQNPNLTDECIKHLPPKLTALYLDNTTRITSKSCKELPRYLEVLDLSNCYDWDPKMLIASKNELPQYIGTINLGNEEANQTWRKIMKD